MKFTPKYVEDHNVNVSKTHPLRHLFVLLGGLVLIAGVVYISLGVVINLTVDLLPEDVEQRISQSFKGHFIKALKSKSCQVNVYKEQEAYAQDLMEEMLKHSEFPNRKFKLYIVDSKQINAFALPGDMIAIHRGLYEKILTKNELAMLIGHELGHFAHRDHLRQLGHNLLFAVVAGTVMAANDTAATIASQVASGGALSHSRGQETKSDIYGMDLVNKTFGHVGGAADLFERLKKLPQSMNNNFFEYGMTHPLTDKRIQKLHTYAMERNYDFNAPESLPAYARITKNNNNTEPKDEP